MMIPQVHADTLLAEEQALSAAEQKQTRLPLEEQLGPTPAPHRRWLPVLLRLLGVVLPLAGGFVYGYPWLYDVTPDYITVNPNAFLTLILMVGLTVLVGALLLRSWWALLLVPLMVYVGVIGATFVAFPLIRGGVTMMQEWLGNWIGGFRYSLWTLMMLVPLIVIAGIGTALSKWLQTRPWQA